MGICCSLRLLTPSKYNSKPKVMCDTISCTWYKITAVQMKNLGGPNLCYVVVKSRQYCPSSIWQGWGPEMLLTCLWARNWIPASSSAGFCSWPLPWLLTPPKVERGISNDIMFFKWVAKTGECHSFLTLHITAVLEQVHSFLSHHYRATCWSPEELLLAAIRNEKVVVVSTHKLRWPWWHLYDITTLTLTLWVIFPPPEPQKTL